MQDISEHKKEIVDNQNRPESPMSSDIVRARIMVAQGIKRNKQELIEELKGLFENKETKHYYSTYTGLIYCIEKKNKRLGTTKKITGLTIEAVKDLANMYKHLDYGLKVINSPDKKTAIGLAWCYDLQNNVSENREFPITYPHWIKSSNNFSDDSYKFAYSEGIRRMRRCIEHILPKWLTDTFEYRIGQLQLEKKKEVGEKTYIQTVLKRAKGLNEALTEADLLKSIGLEEGTEITALDVQDIEQKLTSIETGEIPFMSAFPWLKKQETEIKSSVEDQDRNLLEEIK